MAPRLWPASMGRTARPGGSTARASCCWPPDRGPCFCNLPARRARLDEERRPIGRALGIPDGLLPKDAGAFDRYFAEMLGPDGPVHPTDTARELAPFVLRPRLGALIPVLGWLPPATYSWLQ